MTKRDKPRKGFIFTIHLGDYINIYPVFTTTRALKEEFADRMFKPGRDNGVDVWYMTLAEGMDAWEESSDFRIFPTEEQAMGEGRRVFYKQQMKFERRRRYTPRTKRQAIEWNWIFRNAALKRNTFTKK